MNELDVLRRVGNGQVSFDETDGDLQVILEALYDLHAGGYLQEPPIPHLEFNRHRLAGIAADGRLTLAGASLAGLPVHSACARA